MTADFPLHRFAEFGALSAGELDAVTALGEAPETIARHQAIRREGDPVGGFYLLLDGWAAASVSLPDGGRQLLKIHLPGDALGTPSMCLTQAAETLAAITPAVVSRVSLHRLGALMAAHPRIAGRFLLSVQRERVALMDRLMSIGRTSAQARVAAFLLDIAERLAPLGLVEDDRFALPVTQEQIGDLVGLTGVHVNRMIRELRAARLVEWEAHRVSLLDRPMLRCLAGRPDRQLSTELGWLPPSAGAA